MAFTCSVSHHCDASRDELVNRTNWVDDGDVAILWLGGDADPSEMKDIVGVESAHELPSPLPVSSDVHSQLGPL